jgi:alkylation response protein AidB-like acyl-CoA dehydrogenase
MQAIPSLSLNKTFSQEPPVIDATITELKMAIAKNLAPKVQDIDLKGEYPRDFMHQVGILGGFGQAVSREFGGSGNGLTNAIQVIEAISQECLCTGFITWCQIACAWYMQNSDNEYLKKNVLPKIATGKVLGGTGLSNPMKHFAGIEKIALVAERKSKGYIINGLLPWVSNLGSGHYFGIAAKISNSEQYLMAIVCESMSGLSLKQNAHFIALEGSSTFSCVFRDVFVPDEFILAAPCREYVNLIRPGFILTQVGLGLGLVASCIKIMELTNKKTENVNCFLEDQVQDIATALQVAQVNTYSLASEINYQKEPIESDLFKEVIQARIVGSELSLRAAHAAMLHTGARGYLHGNKAERKLRESYFVAIVTPALKQLKKMLSELTPA